MKKEVEQWLSTQGFIYTSAGWKRITFIDDDKNNHIIKFEELIYEKANDDYSDILGYAYWSRIDFDTNYFSSDVIVSVIKDNLNVHHIFENKKIPYALIVYVTDPSNPASFDTLKDYVQKYTNMTDQFIIEEI